MKVKIFKSHYPTDFYQFLKQLYLFIFRVIRFLFKKLNYFYYLITWKYAWNVHSFGFIINNQHLYDKLYKIVSEDNKNIIKENENYHILLCTSSLSAGGAERQWCYLAVELASRGYSVTLLAERLNGHCGHYLHLLRETQVRVISIEDFKFTIDVASTIDANIPDEIYKYEAIIKLLKPTHILAQLDSANTLASAGAFFSNENIESILLSFRNVNPTHFAFYQPWFLNIYRSVIHSHRITLNANSRMGADDYARWLGIPPTRIYVARNAVRISPETLDARTRIRNELSLEAQTPMVLGVMRLSGEKNPKLFVRTAARIVHEIPQVHIVLAGAGPLDGTVARAVHEYGIDKHFSLLPPRQDIPDLMRAADVFLLTSDWEGMPNVLLEAQSVSLPVVATRVGGVPEAVMDGVGGLLAPRGDEETLVAHCLRLLRNQSLRERMGHAGHRFVAENFSTEAFCDAICRQSGLPARPDRPSFFPSLPERTGAVTLHEAFSVTQLQRMLEDTPVATSRPLIIFAHFPLPESVFSLLPKGSQCLVLPGTTMPRGCDTREIDWRVPDSWKLLEGTLPSNAAALVFDHWPGWKHLDRRFLHLGIRWAIYRDSEQWFLFPLTRVRLLRDLRGLFRTMKALVSERIHLKAAR